VASSLKVAEIVEMVSQAQMLRRDLEEDWIENIRFLMGRFGPKHEFEDVDRVDVNLAWANLMAIMPTLYWRDPRVVARARRPQDIVKAPVVEAAVQYALGKMGTQRTVQRLIVDAHCMAMALVKLGYRTRDVEVAVTIDRATGAMKVVDETEEIDLSEFDVEQRTMAVGETPILGRVSLLSAWIDPLCGDFNDSEWLAQEIIRDVKDVKKDPKYKNTSKLTATGPINDLFSTSKAPSRSSPDINDDQGPYASGITTLAKVKDNQIVLWEFWHKTENKLYVVCPHQGVMLREDDNPYPFFPFAALQLGVPVPDTPYAIPPNSVWKPQQKELNKIRTYTLDHIKREIPKHLVDASKMSKQMQDDLREGVQQVIMVDGSPEGMVTSMPANPVSADTWRCEAAIKTDVQQISGVADYQRAGSAPEGTTATEIRAISNATAARIGYQRYQVSTLIRWVAVGVHQLLRVYWDREEWIKVTGRADWAYEKLDKEAVEGDFEIDIDVGTQLPPDKELEKKGALDQFSILAPIAVQRPDLLKFDELVRYLMEKLEVPNPERFLVSDDQNRPPANPENEEELLFQGGMPIFSPNDNHPQHILIHTQGLQEAKDDQDRWRRLMHLKKHLDYEEQQRMAVAMQQSMMLQQVQQAAGGMGPPPLGGVPPPGGGPGGNVVPLQGGQGRANPAPGYPIQPRMFNQQAPNPTQQTRVDSRKVGQ
jgi:hypothetical protein